MSTSRIVLAATAALAASLLAATPASASIAQIGSFGKTGPGALSEPAGIAVDQASEQRVRQDDPGMHRVVKYDQSKAASS